MTLNALNIVTGIDILTLRNIHSVTMETNWKRQEIILRQKTPNLFVIAEGIIILILDCETQKKCKSIYEKKNG